MISLVTQYYRLLKRDEKIGLLKSHRPDDKQLRDFVYVKDCMDGTPWMMGAPRLSGPRNLGSGTAQLS